MTPFHAVVPPIPLPGIDRISTVRRRFRPDVGCHVVRRIDCLAPVQLNREIADRERWRRPEIQHRATALAERIIASWPGPISAAADLRSEVPWDVMNRALAELPAGSWTTYGDVAALIGTAPMPLGVRLATHPTPNAHRVLQAGGTVSPGFRWPDPDRKDDPRKLLEAEGVEFDRNDRRRGRTSAVSSASAPAVFCWPGTRATDRAAPLVLRAGPGGGS